MCLYLCVFTKLLADVNAATHKLANTRKSLSTCIESLTAESRILDRIIYRNSNQFRSQKCFQLICGVNRYARGIIRLALVELLDAFKAKIPSTKTAFQVNGGLMRGQLLPSLSTIHYLLDTLLSAAGLAKRLVDFCPSVFSALSHEISKGLFMNVNMAGLAIVSRMSALCGVLFASATHCYSGWRPAMLWTQSVRFNIDILKSTSQDLSTAAPMTTNTKTRTHMQKAVVDHGLPLDIHAHFGLSRHDELRYGAAQHTHAQAAHRAAHPGHRSHAEGRGHAGRRGRWACASDARGRRRQR